MKKYLLFFSLLLLFSQCEKPYDCVKSTGPTQSKVYDGLDFHKLIVNKRISVIITQGASNRVEVHAGENLINDIEVKTEGGTLTLTDNTSCNWVRDYGQTVVYITTPNLTDIYSKTEQTISSNGVLTFPNLHLVAMDDIDGYKGVGTGDYNIKINNDILSIENNDVSRYYITGTTNYLVVNFYENGGIFHGENLLANEINLFHRGSNDLFVHPINKISGGIFNVGNVYCYSHPPINTVVRHYRGRMIYL
jgi:hypothetical protein